MQCVANLKWVDEDSVWLATVDTKDGEPTGVVLESGSFDALLEKVKTATLELLELNFNYVGEVELTIETERKESLRAISWQPRVG